MISIILAAQVAELCGWGALRAKMKGNTRRQLLIHGRNHTQSIPIVDSQLKKLAGHPNKITNAMGGRLIALVRRIVNTKAFEHVVIGLLNSKSKLREQLQRRTQ